jgi:CDP-paratose 2-epimerase
LIVVLGGAGFVGSHVAQFYAQKGENVRVVDNRSRAELLRTDEGPLTNWDWVKTLPGVEPIEASILDAEELLRLVEGADAIVHTAAQTAVTVSVEDPKTDFLVNALGTLNVLEATRQVAPDAALVFCSTNKVYGGNVNALPVREEPRRYSLGDEWARGIPETLSIDLCEHSPYGVSKTAADLYVQEYGHLYGIKSSVLRMSCIYGPHQWAVSDQGWLAWFARATIEGSQVTIFGDGRQTRDVLFVSDLVSAIDLALRVDRKGDVYNIGGGPQHTLSLLEALDLIAQLTGRTTHIRYADWRPSDQRVYISDISKAQRILGWTPTVSPQEGIRDLVHWLTRDRLHDSSPAARTSAETS